MSRNHRLHALVATLATLALGAPDRAEANTPPASTSTVPSQISLVGTNGGAPASGFGAFHVVIRDLANNPIEGAVVTIDLSLALDLTLCADQLDPSLTVNCAFPWVNGTTNAAGQAFFTLLGGSNGTGNATSGINNGRIYANGTLLGTPTVSAYDLDGVNGLGANDLSAFLTDFASGEPFGRSDYDGSSVLGANDLALWLTAFASATQTASCGAACP